MVEFDNRLEMNDYYYNLFCSLSDNRMLLSKRMLNEIEKDIFSEYCLCNKLLVYNEKFNLKIEFKKLLLDRKQKKKDFRFYKKQFYVEYCKVKPVVIVAVNNNIVYMSANTLPKLKYKSNIKGSIKWESVIIEPGKNYYNWVFIPKDNKYSIVHGSILLMVIDDTQTSEN